MLRGATIVVVAVVAAVVGATMARVGIEHHPASAATVDRPLHSTQFVARRAPTVALQVRSVQPVDATIGVAPDTPIVLHLRTPLPVGSPHPTVVPNIEGRWVSHRDTLEFLPRDGFLPLSEVTVTAPAAPRGNRAQGDVAPGTVLVRYRVRNGSILRLQQLLAIAGYSPLVWTPAAPEPAPADSAAMVASLYRAPAGSFSWARPTWPRRFRSLFEPGAFNTFTRGLLASFEASHALTPDGDLGPGVWSALLAAVAARSTTAPHTFSFALVNKAGHLLTVWYDGRTVLRTQIGASAAAAEEGASFVTTRTPRTVLDGVPAELNVSFGGAGAFRYVARPAARALPAGVRGVVISLAQARQVWRYLGDGSVVDVAA